MRCQTFSFFFFRCSADHERDWPPPCKVVFFELTTKMLNVRNSKRFVIAQEFWYYKCSWTLLQPTDFVQPDSPPLLSDRVGGWESRSVLNSASLLLLSFQRLARDSASWVLQPARCSSTGYQYSELLFFSCLFSGQIKPYDGSSGRG